MSKLIVKRALISVYHKDKIVDFAKFLETNNVEIISSPGTYKMLKTHDIKSLPVEKFVECPNLFEGIIKTLYPGIFASILCKRDRKSENKDIKPIDLVVVNFLPFEQLVMSGEKSIANLVEMIDIGGPALLRAAGKNYKYVCPVSSPDHYKNIMEEIKTGGITLETRLKMAVEVFKKIVHYDNIISESLKL